MKKEILLKVRMLNIVPKDNESKASRNVIRSKEKKKLRLIEEEKVNETMIYD